MRYSFRIIRTQTAERTIPAADEDAATRKLREELAQPYGFFGRWQDAALDVELVGIESNVTVGARGADGGPLLLSVKDGAGHVGITRGLMYELLRTGEIEGLRIGQRRFVSREAINRFIDTHSTSNSI